MSAREQTDLKSPILTLSGRIMRTQALSFWLSVVILGVLAFTPLSAQDAQAGQNSAAQHSSVPGESEGGPVVSDWSYHHVIFSQPATPEQARRVENDPRYWQQIQRQQAVVKPSAPASDVARPMQFREVRRRKPLERPFKAMRDWSEDLGSNSTQDGSIFPAKYSFRLGAATCASDTNPDFVVFPTGLSGSGIQATIAAYDNLYTGCTTGTVPETYWAYNTGTGYSIANSPAFSRDGKQVAFVQSDTTLGLTYLVLLKWAASTTETVGAPGTPTDALLAANYPTCTAPCMYEIELGHGPLEALPDADTGSWVFVDITDDTAWVGDNSGYLHKFTPFFNGTPTEVTSGFPLQMNTTTPAALTSPVHDFASGNVFVGDVNGFLYRVSSSGGTVTKSGQLDISGAAMTEGPVVDSTNGLVYVFSSSDGSGNASVFELPTSFAGGATGSKAVVGTSSANPVYVGAFDSTYQNSTGATGNLYVCGNTSGAPTIYQVPIVSGSFGTPIAGPLLSSSPPCSPVTDIYNPNASPGPTEFLFASITAAAVSDGCSDGGCVYNFNDTPWKKSTSYVLGQEILDTNLHIEVVTTAGTSGTGTPHWPGVVEVSTTDGSVHWIDQGAITSTTPKAWAAGTYGLDQEVLDSNGNIEIVTGAGVSGSTPPAWNTTPGGTTQDPAGGGGVTWTNIGLLPTSALAETDGTSGIIIDNIVGSGTLAGASQIYFFTLGNGACGGRCAVQASQSNLK
jgi:hypothetical protein